MRDKMYKKIMAAAVTIVLLVTAGCGGASTTANKKVTMDVATVAGQIVKQGSFKDELELLEDDMFAANYEAVDESLINKKCVYTGSGATAEQVVVVEAKDADAAGKVKDQLNSKVQNDIEVNKDYLPNEIPKLESAVLKVVDRYTILVVSNDNSNAEEIVNKECK